MTLPLTQVKEGDILVFDLNVGSALVWDDFIGQSSHVKNGETEYACVAPIFNSNPKVRINIYFFIFWLRLTDECFF